MHHELKIEVPYYHAVKSGLKTFEIRNNDRGFQKGDTVTFSAWDGCYLTEYERIRAEITYVTGYAQKENWVVFGIMVLG